MNKRVYESMLGLCILFLVLSYIVKLIFPDYFVLTISNENLLKFGNFVQSNHIVYFIITTALGSITYYIYTCACCRFSKLNNKGIVLIIIINIISYFAYNHTTFGVAYGTITMLLLPAIYGATLKDTAFIYAIHGICQIVSLNLRGFQLLVGINYFLGSFVLCFDAYIWLALVWLVQIKNKEVGIWETFVLPITEKIKNFYSPRLKKHKK